MPTFGFSQEIIRLLRTKWQDPQTLAEEMFAIFREDMTFDITGPLTIRIPEGSTEPAIRIVDTRTDFSVPPIQVFKPDPVTGWGTTNLTTPNPAVPGIIPNTTTGDNTPWPTGSGTGGGTDFTKIDFPTTPDPEAVPEAGAGPITMYGEVVSKFAATQYNVQVWARAPSTYPPIGTIVVNVGLIDSAEVIPAGTPVYVVCYLGNAVSGRFGIDEAWMQPPVFVTG